MNISHRWRLVDDDDDELGLFRNTSAQLPKRELTVVQQEPESQKSIQYFRSAFGTISQRINCALTFATRLGAHTAEIPPGTGPQFGTFRDYSEACECLNKGTQRPTCSSSADKVAAMVPPSALGSPFFHRDETFS